MSDSPQTRAGRWKRWLVGTPLALIVLVRTPEIIMAGGWRRWTLIAGAELLAVVAIADFVGFLRRRRQR